MADAMPGLVWVEANGEGGKGECQGIQTEVAGCKPSPTNPPTSSLETTTQPSGLGCSWFIELNHAIIVEGTSSGCLDYRA
jgi:hypothetical protein